LAGDLVELLIKERKFKRAVEVAMEVEGHIVARLKALGLGEGRDHAQQEEICEEFITSQENRELILCIS
jgi:hypothetical protein